MGSNIFPSSLGIPVGEFHRGNTSEYLLRAATNLGIHAEILDNEQFIHSVNTSRFEIYLGVDSGKPIDFTNPVLTDLRKVGYWFIDYRHNKERASRSPMEAANAAALHTKGGTVFQSQYEDYEDSRSRGLTRVNWLPLAADPVVWSDQPVVNKEYDIGFVGNVWDKGRAAALELLLKQPDIRVAFRGHGAAWKEEGAGLLRRSRLGFNVNSWFGQPHDYDVNMRVYETLSCGIPLITNFVPGIERVFGSNPRFIRTYRDLGELPSVVRQALRSPDFMETGSEGRAFILAHCTYELRLKTAIERIISQ